MSTGKKIQFRLFTNADTTHYKYLDCNSVSALTRKFSSGQRSVDCCCYLKRRPFCLASTYVQPWSEYLLPNCYRICRACINREEVVTTHTHKKNNKNQKQPHEGGNYKPTTTRNTKPSILESIRWCRLEEGAAFHSDASKEGNGIHRCLQRRKKNQGFSTKLLRVRRATTRQCLQRGTQPKASPLSA
jgi:hypothetical protein